MSKAIVDKITLKINLNYVLLKHIMNLPIKFEDLKHLDFEVYNSLTYIINNPIDPSLDLTFTWEAKNSQNISEPFELKENGKNILVNDSNKNEFVELVLNFITYKSIKSKLDAFLLGFRFLLKPNYLNIFTFEELDFLISGQNKIDLQDWKNNTVYKGLYNEKHKTINYFWESLTELSDEKLLLFYKFCTGSTRIPIDGFNSLQGSRNKYQKFCIDSGTITESDNKCSSLIEAYTCFNRIVLPLYKSKDQIRDVIDKILENDTNYFGRQ